MPGAVFAEELPRKSVLVIGRTTRGGGLHYPSHDEAMRTTPILRWIDEHFLRSDPFAFKDANFRLVVRAISEELRIDPNGIYCIGSGAIGFSFNPGKMTGHSLKQFDHESDLDLALISEVYFETAWRDLRRASQPTMDPMDSLVRRHIDWQRKRLFDGAILASHLLPSLSFGPTWISANVRISQQIAIILGREIAVNYWIYRDYWSVRNYVANGVVKCRRHAIT